VPTNLIAHPLTPLAKGDGALVEGTKWAVPKSCGWQGKKSITKDNGDGQLMCGEGRERETIECGDIYT